MITRPLAILLALSSPTLADNHTTGDAIPYCGDIDSGVSEPSPVCIAWDGDAEAEPWLEPGQACPNGQRFEGMNCIETDAGGAELLALSRKLYGDGNAVGIAMVEPDEPACDTAFCAGPFTPWTDDIWHGPGHEDGADVSGRSRESRAEPQPSQSPERSEPPARSEAPTNECE